MGKVDSLKNKHGASEIIVTGHSLGGALSTLSGYFLRKKYGGMVKLYNFGCPRVGNESFYKKMKSMFGSTAYRVVHKDDIVPHWPKAITHEGYHHIEKEVWYKGDDDKYKVCDESGEDPNCSNSWTGLSIPDHLYYLGKSALCNKYQQEDMELLKEAASEVESEFYDMFKDLYLNCDPLTSDAKLFEKAIVESKGAFSDSELIM